MKAVVQSRYGSPNEVLQLTDIVQPVPADDEVLVRVRAASVHPDVWHVVTGRPYVLRLMGGGVFKPKVAVPGTDLSGLVEVVGNKVTHLRVGDAVFGESLKGMQWVNGGAYAQYACVAQDALALKPPGISFEQAAAVPTAGLIVLLNLQNERQIKPGHKVLVNGAGGGVGSIALQFAKACGAWVTAVDGAEKLEMLRALGADRVVDYAQEDFAELGERYDLIFDVASNRSFADCKKALSPTGIYVLIGHDHYGAGAGRTWGSLPRFLKLVMRAPFDRHLQGMFFSAPSKKDSMAVLQGLLATGKLTPVVDKTFPLSAVPEALAYLQSGKARGRTIITL